MSKYNHKSKKSPFTHIVCLSVSTLLFIAGCSYKITLNEQTIYDPPSLLTEYSLTDEALQKCVESSIKESKITSITQLTALQCIDNGIKSLNGIEVFTQLSILRLDNNLISDITPLSKLERLSKLSLVNNQITSVAILNNLPLLMWLDLRTNPLTICDELTNTPIRQVIVDAECQD